MTNLKRTTFETSRAGEYFDARELQAQTGQPLQNFAAVALKELVDNAGLPHHSSPRVHLMPLFPLPSPRLL
jgi:hypothetical protein